MSELHVFKFESWDEEDSFRSQQHPNEQIKHLTERLFAGAWKDYEPSTCAVSMPWGDYAFLNAWTPLPVHRTSKSDDPVTESMLLGEDVKRALRRAQPPLICGFVKARNEIIREGNIYRCVENLKKFCDVIVACDDASTDGTADYLRQNVDHLIEVPPQEHNFAAELRWKQRMLELVREKVKPVWIYWADADELLDDQGVEEIRKFCEAKRAASEAGWSFHYTQLWRADDFARTDAGFDDGSWIKLWRWTPELSFPDLEGTHQWQVPLQIGGGKIGTAPWEILHRGNVGKNLAWKAIQYWGGLGSPDRHLNCEAATFRPVSSEAKEGCRRPPRPLTVEEKDQVRRLRDMHALERTFAVVIPTYNRAHTLSRALGSLRAQTYQNWIALVLDDGSNDHTPALMRDWQDTDQRIFYCRYPEHRGAVVMNEIGMDMATEFCSWWTRLGSDDYFEPNKLALDAAMLVEHAACYGPYAVLRGRDVGEVCNPPRSPEDIRSVLVDRQEFLVSWANIAVRTSVLARIKAKYGSYCDPRLLSMEDFHINSRIARETPFAWRGPGDSAVPSKAYDAVWRINPVGCSSNMLTGMEQALTRQIIKRENENYPTPVVPSQMTRFWTKACDYPIEKERHYSGHAEAHGFDAMTGKNVLEYGCGGGSDTLSMLRRGAHVWYADIVPLNVATTKERILEKHPELDMYATPVVLENGAKLCFSNSSTDATTPVPEGFFDAISSHGVIHHIRDPLPVLHELCRVLKPGGTAYIMLYHPLLVTHYRGQIQHYQALYGVSELEAFGWATDGKGCPYARHYTVEEARDLFTSSGFGFRGWQEYNHGMFVTYWLSK